MPMPDKPPDFLEESSSPPPGNWRSWLIWGAAAIFYLYEFFVRVAPSVMEEQLQEALHVTAAAFGASVAAYYYVYAPLQLVVGSLMDRFGARLVLIPSVLVVALGCLLETFAGTLLEMTLARGLQGLGSAFAFVGAMYLAAQWFPHNKLALIAGLTTTLGMLGGIVGNAGLAWLVDEAGYKATLHMSWIAGIGIFVLLLLVIPKPPPWAQKALLENPEEPARGMIGGILSVLGNPQSWLIGFTGACLYLPLTIIGGLWGVNYVMTASGVSKETASTAVSLLYVGWVVGAPLAGWLSDKLEKRRMLLIASTILTLLTTVLLTLFVSLHIAAMLVLLLAIGLASSVQVVTFVSAVEVNKPGLHGTALSVNNMLVMLLGGLAQPLFGVILDWSSGGGAHYTAHDYRTAMFMLPACSLLAVAASLFLKESFKKDSGPVMH